jgi:hypothetical protein
VEHGRQLPRHDSRSQNGLGARVSGPDWKESVFLEWSLVNRKKPISLHLPTNAS